MRNNDDYVYYTNDWNDPFIGWKRNNDNLMWRYWAAKEMANTICIDMPIFSILKREENYLIQLLKKEWFR